MNKTIPRPSINDKYYIKTAMLELAKQVIDWENTTITLNDEYDEGELDNIADQLTKAYDYSYDKTNYSIAKYLDDTYGYSVDNDLLEIIDQMDILVYKEINKAIKQWVSIYNIKPDKNEGDIVQYKGKNYTICSIDKEKAIYKLGDMNDTRRLLVNYEDVIGNISVSE